MPMDLGDALIQGQVNDEPETLALSDPGDNFIETPASSLIPDLATRAGQVFGSAERAIVSFGTFLGSLARLAMGDPLYEISAWAFFLPVPAFAGAAAGVAPGMMRYSLMMSGSDGGPPSERNTLLQYVPGYRGRVPPEERADLIVKLDELEPTETAPSIGVTLPDGTSYLFKGGVKVLSDVTDVLSDGEVVTVINNYPTAINIGRVTKLGQHVVSVEEMDKDGVLGPKKITLFIKIWNRARGGVSIHPVSFPASDLHDLRGSRNRIISKFIQRVRIAPVHDSKGRLDRFEVTMKLRQGLELDVEKFIIPASVSEDDASEGTEQAERTGEAPQAVIGVPTEVVEPIADEPTNVIDISGRLGGVKAAAPLREPGSVANLWPKGVDKLRKGLKVLLGREADVTGESVSGDPRVADFERMFRHPDDRARFERLSECSMERAVQLLMAGDNEFFVIVGTRLHSIFKTFITLATYAEDPDMIGEFLLSPENRAEADSDARVMKALIAVVEDDPWLLLKSLGAYQAENLGRGMGAQIRGFYESAKRGLEVYRMWRRPYPGTNPDGTVDLNGGLPLDKMFRGLFRALRRKEATGKTPQAEQRQNEVAVEIPHPSLPFAELAKNPTIRPRLKLALKIAEARELKKEEAWMASEPIAVAIVGYLPITDEARQDAAERNIALIDRFITGTELDVVVVGGMEEPHILEMDRASKIGTVMAAFPKREEDIKLMREKLESAGWRAGIGRLGGRLAIMAVKAGRGGSLPPLILEEETEVAVTDGRERSSEPTVVAKKIPPRPPTIKWDGRQEDPALAQTGEMPAAGGGQVTEYMIGGGPGGRVVEKITKSFSPKLKGILNGPVMEKLLNAIPDTDEATIELAGQVYKIVFLQGLTVGEEVKSRIDMVADIAGRMGDTGKADMKFAEYEEGQLLLFAEVFDSITAAAASAEQRPYARQMMSLLKGSGRDLPGILRLVSRYTGKSFLSFQ